MLTDVSPSGQFYGAQIPTMGMNITNITNHIQKPSVSKILSRSTSIIFNFHLQSMKYYICQKLQPFNTFYYHYVVKTLFV